VLAPVELTARLTGKIQSAQNAESTRACTLLVCVRSSQSGFLLI